MATNLNAPGEPSVTPTDAPLQRHATADGCGCEVPVGELVTFLGGELCLAHAVFEVGTLMVAENLSGIPELVQARDILAQALAQVETDIKRATLRRPSPTALAIAAICRPLVGGHHG